MKHTRLNLVAVVCAVLSAAAPPRAAAADGLPPLQLTIAFTGDVNGYLEPCG